MPLIKRKVKTATPTVFAVRYHDHVHYVPPSEVQPVDEIVEPTDRQLVELAEAYPDEYRQQARERGVLPQLTAEQFGALGFDAAIAEIEECDDVQLLGEWYQAELAKRPRPRTSVLEAFQAKGIGEEPDSGENGGENEPEGEEE